VCPHGASAPHRQSNAPKPAYSCPPRRRLTQFLFHFLPILAPCSDVPKAAGTWSLTSLREKLIKIGAKGRKPRPLRDIPNGRSCDATADVRGYPMLIARLRTPPASA
jgi:hypothetical protein